MFCAVLEAWVQLRFRFLKAAPTVPKKRVGAVLSQSEVGLGRMDFFADFIFGPPDFFADVVAGFFLLIFVGKSAQKNHPEKSPAKASKIYTTKIPDTFLQRGQAKSWHGGLQSSLV